MSSTKPRFKITKGGYLFDRHLMRAMFLPMFLLLLGIAIWGYVNQPVWQCPDEEPVCLNQYYGLCDKEVCAEEYVNHVNIPFWVDYGDLFAILVAGSYFLINHFWHNKKNSIRDI